MNAQVSDQPVLLLVDDDKVFCKVLKSALERRGFEVLGRSQSREKPDFWPNSICRSMRSSTYVSVTIQGWNLLKNSYRSMRIPPV